MITNSLKKICGRCKKLLPRDCFRIKFYVNRGKEGLYSYCKDCSRLYNNALYKRVGQRKQHKAKTNAQAKARYAINTGKLKRLPCSVCGSTNRIHAHHEDYSKPLDVIFLCPFHHKERHSELRRNGRIAS